MMTTSSKHFAPFNSSCNVHETSPYQATHLARNQRGYQERRCLENLQNNNNNNNNLIGWASTSFSESHLFIHISGIIMIMTMIIQDDRRDCKSLEVTSLKQKSHILSRALTVHYKWGEKKSLVISFLILSFQKIWTFVHHLLFSSRSLSRKTLFILCLYLFITWFLFPLSFSFSFVIPYFSR